MSDINSRVMQARIEAGMTQTELGEKIGKTKQWICELEKGRIKLSYENGIQIAEATGKPADFFYHGGQAEIDNESIAVDSE